MSKLKIDSYAIQLRVRNWPLPLTQKVVGIYKNGFNNSRNLQYLGGVGGNFHELSAPLITVVSKTSFGLGKPGICLPDPIHMAYFWNRSPVFPMSGRKVFDCAVTIASYGMAHALLVTYHQETDSWSWFDPNGRSPFMYEEFKLDQVLAVVHEWIGEVVSHMDPAAKQPVFKPLLDKFVNDSPEEKKGWCVAHCLTMSNFMRVFGHSPEKAQRLMIAIPDLE